MPVKSAHVPRIGISHGKFNYKRASGSVFVSAVKAGGMITSGFVMPKDRYKESADKVIYLPSHTSGRKEMGGFATNKVIEVPNGHILRVVNNRKKNGREYLNASMIILVHEKAGSIQVAATLPVDTCNALGKSISVFEGRGIVLSDDDVSDLQYDMNGLFVRKYRNEEELDEAFIVSTISSGLGIEGFSSNKRANGIVDIIAKCAPPRRKITLI